MWLSHSPWSSVTTTHLTLRLWGLRISLPDFHTGVTSILPALLAPRCWCWSPRPCFSSSPEQQCEELQRGQPLECSVGPAKAHPAEPAPGQPSPVPGGLCTQGAPGWEVTVSKASFFKCVHKMKSYWLRAVHSCHICSGFCHCGVRRLGLQRET